MKHQKQLQQLEKRKNKNNARNAGELKKEIQQRVALRKEKREKHAKEEQIAIGEV